MIPSGAGLDSVPQGLTSPGRIDARARPDPRPSGGGSRVRPSVLWRGLRVAASATAALRSWPHMLSRRKPPSLQSLSQALRRSRPAAQQIRDELDRLSREFESVRDTYGARLTALEARLAQLQGTPAPPAPPAGQPPAEAPGPPATGAPPAAAGGAGAPAPPSRRAPPAPEVPAALPVYRNTAS